MSEIIFNKVNSFNSKEHSMNNDFYAKSNSYSIDNAPVVSILVPKVTFDKIMVNFSNNMLSVTINDSDNDIFDVINTSLVLNVQSPGIFKYFIEDHFLYVILKPVSNKIKTDMILG